MSSRREIVLVRHGETAWTLAGKHTGGKTDIPLTDEGRRQAGLLRARLAGRTFERVLTSPLRRAAETCELVGLGAKSETRDDLREWDYGTYDGRTTAEIRAEVPEWSRWRDGYPLGESVAEVGRRADRVVAELLGISGDGIVFAHGHLLRVLAARWVEMAPEAGARFGLGTCTLSALGFERETRVIWLWNDDTHLATDQSVRLPRVAGRPRRAPG
jgi:probable phosphoglycerate mutase